jgi:hypothetical protein
VAVTFCWSTDAKRAKRAAKAAAGTAAAAADGNGEDGAGSDFDFDDANVADGLVGSEVCYIDDARMLLGLFVQ